MTFRPEKLLDQPRETVLQRHYPYRTEETYVAWVKPYIRYHIVLQIEPVGAITRMFSIRRVDGKKYRKVTPQTGFVADLIDG